MAQQFIKKVGVTPVDEGVHGQIIDSMSATTDKTTNAPSIRMALSNGVPAGSVIDYEGETVPDGYIRRDDIPTLSELNDNLTASLYSTSLSDISAIIDEYISSTNMTKGEKRHFTVGNYYCEITKIDNPSADRYVGIIIRATSNERYTFYKNGSTSTAINSF